MRFLYFFLVVFLKLGQTRPNKGGIMKNDNAIINSSKEFALSHSPLSYIVSVHMQNLMLTYGETKVKKIIKELFFSEKVKNAKNKKTANI